MKILNFGSLNIDSTYRVDHFVRPGETILSRGMSVQSGGKGLNQSIAAARAGAQVFHAGKVGADGGMLTKQLADAGVDISMVRESGQYTGRAIIQLDSTGQNCILLYSGANHDIDTPFIDSVLSHFSKGDILLLQNEINAIAEIMCKAHERGIRIAFNPSPISEELFQYPMDTVDWFFLNEIEGEALTGEKRPEKIADSLLKKYPSSNIVLTLGKLGVYYRDAGNCMRHGVYEVQRVDTTGAGDTFTGFFAAGIAAGTDVAENLRRASVASSLAVTRKGAAASIPTLREVLDARLSPARAGQ